MCRSFFLLLFNCAYCNLNEILWHIIDSWRCAVCWWDDSFTNMALWKLGILFILTYFILLAKQFLLDLRNSSQQNILTQIQLFTCSESFNHITLYLPSDWFFFSFAKMLSQSARKTLAGMNYFVDKQSIDYLSKF